MPGWSRRVGENRRSGRSKARRCGGCVVGLGTAAGAFLALGMTPLAAAPSAHADIEDLIIQPIVDAIAHAAASLAEPSLSTALGPSLDFGSLMAPALAADVGAAGATVPLQINDVTQPVIDLSVNGGPTMPVLVDTGSDGLVIPLQDMGLQTLSFPIGAGIGAYSGGLDYFYLTFDMPVNFGDGIVTAPTPVDVAVFEFPETLQAFFAPGGAVGDLGIGPDSVGPGPSIVTAALPGDLNEGVLINESQHVLEFGPNPDAAGVTVDGAPISTLDVSVNNGPLQPVSVDIDSGGVYGTIPASVLNDGQTSGMVPAGTLISVYTTNGQLLYSYTTNATDGPTVTSGDTMNTGYIPFQQNPVYISYSPSGVGTVTFDH